VPALNINRRYLFATLAVLLLAFGCDGGNDSPPPSDGTPPGSSGVIQVRGTERIAWAQQIDSGSVNGYQFFALVDDDAMALPGVQCAASGSGGDCSAALPRMSPGRHKFQLVAINAQGVQSPPSDALMLNVAAGQGAPATSDDTGSSLCPGCGTLEILASGLGRIDELVALPDGALLILHDGQHLLRFRDGALTEAARVDEARDPSTRWISVDLHPDFPDMPFVFALTLRDAAGGSRTTSVVRMRAVGDALIEQITVVPEIALNSSIEPELSVGADRLLYLAIPRVDDGAPRSPYGGMLLRFTTEGSAAGNASGTSPVLASGAARPGPMAWDGAQRLWLSENELGIRESGLQLVSSGTRSNNGTRGQSRRIPSALVGGGQLSGLAFASGSETPSAYLIAGLPGVIYRVLLRSEDNPTVVESRAVLGGSMDFTALARGSRGELFVAAIDGSEGSLIARVQDPSKLLPLNGRYASLR
jgi:hypothetical protein